MGQVNENGGGEAVVNHNITREVANVPKSCYFYEVMESVARGKLNRCSIYTENEIFPLMVLLDSSISWRFFPSRSLKQRRRNGKHPNAPRSQAMQQTGMAIVQVAGERQVLHLRNSLGGVWPNALNDRTMTATWRSVELNASRCPQPFRIS
jgi:hypothetical protein